MIGGVVFDFDGTLTELTLDFQQLKSEVLKVLAEYIPSEILEKRSSLLMIEMIYELAADCEPEKAKTVVEAGFRRLWDLECEAAQGKDVFPFTRDVLGWLKRRDIRIAIATRTCREALDIVFKDSNEYVDTVITSADTRWVKPNPYHIETALSRLRIVPEKAVMVGDHPTDVIAGKACRMKTVGVLSGATGKEAFERAGADYIARDIRSLPEIISELTGRTSRNH
jgi:phosphoglycolate phosphatase